MVHGVGESSLVGWVTSWVMLVPFLLPSTEAHLLHGGYRLSQLNRGEDTCCFSSQPPSELMSRQDRAIPGISEELHELTHRLT